MAFTQQKFLNSSIASFNSSIGWNSQESRLTVNLVDDPLNDDYFSPPEVGSPVYFNYNGWEFNGLLEKYTISGSSAGSPLYEVSVVDPRVLLDGVQVILSEYTYSINSIPNILNVYGYLESGGFGNSYANESGIQWFRVAETAQALANGGGISTYGGPIMYKGFGYRLDISNLPLLPIYYRIQGSPSISLLDMISEICTAAGSEFFVRLEENYTIRVYTIGRANIPNRGMINQFVSTTDGAISKNVGEEMVNDICAKFLIGGKKTNNSIRFKTNDENYTNPIWSYWGYDLDGRVILSTGSGDEEAFTLDMRAINYVYGSWYPTNVGEVRAALQSQESWESYLALYSYVEYIPDPNGSYTAHYYVRKYTPGIVGYTLIPSSGTYIHNGVVNPHFGKSETMRIVGDAAWDQTVADSDGTAIPSHNYMNLTSDIYDPVHERAIREFYGMYRSYVEQYYGKQFMVDLPDLFVKVEPDTNRLSYSQMPTDGGYLTDAQIEDSQQNNLLPINYDQLTLDDGRLECYARFDDYNLLDLSLFRDGALSTVPNQDILVGRNGKSVFVKCTVDQKIIFLTDNYTNARAIITLPGIFSERINTNFGNSIINTFMTGMGKADIVDRIAKSPNADLLNSAQVPRAVHPNFISVPMESQVDTYGPWYVAGAIGKTEIEYASDLVPWNYGGYEIMNLSAEARVLGAAANLQWLETGSVEYPDVPVLQLGDQLLQSGPYVTDISVDIGEGGTKTIYRMSSWTPRFGKFVKANADRMQKLSKLINETRKNTRQMILTKVKR